MVWKKMLQQMKFRVAICIYFVNIFTFMSMDWLVIRVSKTEASLISVSDFFNRLFDETSSFFEGDEKKSLLCNGKWT